MNAWNFQRGEAAAADRHHLTSDSKGRFFFPPQLSHNYHVIHHVVVGICSAEPSKIHLRLILFYFLTVLYPRSPSLSLML